MSWEKKNPEKITFDATMKDKELIGRITNIGRAGRLNVNTYVMVTADDKLVTFLGNTVLDKVLSDEAGSLVKIVYTGDMPTSGGFKVKQFDVFVDHEAAPDEALAPEPESEPEPEPVKANKKK